MPIHDVYLPWNVVKIDPVYSEIIGLKKPVEKKVTSAKHKSCGLFIAGSPNGPVLFCTMTSVVCRSRL